MQVIDGLQYATGSKTIFRRVRADEASSAPEGFPEQADRFGDNRDFGAVIDGLRYVRLCAEEMERIAHGLRPRFFRASFEPGEAP